jgi:hypothetical protein
MASSDRGIAMLDDVIANYFYKLGCNIALNKFGASLNQPPDQTFQSHHEIQTPATNGPEDGSTDEVNYTNSTTQDLWNEHDRRIQVGLVPPIDSKPI